MTSKNGTTARELVLSLLLAASVVTLTNVIDKHSSPVLIFWVGFLFACFVVDFVLWIRRDYLLDKFAREVKEKADERK